MRTHHDAKVMAKTLRDELKQHKLDLPHGQCLDIVARQFGLKDWNVLAAKLEEKETDQLSIPGGWIKAGTAPQLYEMGAMETQPGIAIIRRLKDVEPAMQGVFGTLRQTIAAEDFKGQNIAFECELKTKDVAGSATIWVRIEDKDKKTLAFNNLEKRPVDGSISGTHDWSPRRIVLPVANEATTIHFGFYLNGFGEVQARGFKFDLTDAPADSTEPAFPKKPENLGLKILKLFR